MAVGRGPNCLDSDVGIHHTQHRTKTDNVKTVLEHSDSEFLNVLHRLGPVAVPEIGAGGALPILRENNCPYSELADGDRGICELEQEVFQRVLGADVKLSQCCLDGHHCCEFEVSQPVSASVAG